MRAYRTTVAALMTCLLATTAGAQDLVTKSKGRAHGDGLKMKSSNVPTFDLVQKKMINGKQELVRVQSIPRLDLGEEPRLQASDLAPVPLPSQKSFNPIDAKEQPSPKEIFTEALTLKKTAIVGAPKQLITIDHGAMAPPLPTLPVVQNPSVMEPKASLVKMEEVQPVEMKMLQALIFLEKQKNYPLAMALFAELLDDPSVKTEATYQLALTAKGLGLYLEYKYRMQQVLNDSNPEWQRKAAWHLAQNSGEGDKDLVVMLDPKLEKLQVTLERADQYQMNRAKHYLDKGDLTKSFASVDEIMMDSPLYTEALFLKSLILYRGGQLQEGVGLMQTVVDELQKKRPTDEITAIAALTLARLNFQAGQYKEAFQNYLKIDKKHPEWLQAMTEQAWAQILSGDYEGAAGNMFSMHSDFFKKAFQPESYVVRTVAYLNLCQYGDGAKVVYDFKNKYEPVLKQLDEYKKNMKNPVNYYDTIKTWAKNPDLKTVDGLPREFIFFLTRHPSFILEQKMINTIEDETGRMNRISVDLIKAERKALAAQNDAKAQLMTLKKQAQEAKDSSRFRTQVAYQEQRLTAHKINHYIAKKARTAIKDMRTVGLERLEKEKNHFRTSAGNAVKSRFDGMVLSLKNSLDQSEVLNYELYSGAGEHLRYQMAGGDINTKERPELKVEKGKDLNWDFRGEIWEDELGHFRSSLKNVCPPEESLSQLDTK